LQEFAELSLSVMGPRGGLGVVLDCHNGILPVPKAFDGAVIEVKVGHHECLSSGDGVRIAPDGESMVL
jgi:hypothetical protein